MIYFNYINHIDGRLHFLGEEPQGIVSCIGVYAVCGIMVFVTAAWQAAIFL
jgi:hypothetical protein